MAIQMVCPACGRGAEVPDEWAGKRGKCKGCGGIIVVPAKVAEAEARVATDVRYEPPALRPEILPAATVPPPMPARVEPPAGHLVYSTPQPQTVPCPFCAEPIQPAAKKCKHCGEYLDPVLRKANEKPTPVVQHASAPPPPPNIVVHNVVQSVSNAVAVGGRKKGMGCCSLFFLAAVIAGIVSSVNRGPTVPDAPTIRPVITPQITIPPVPPTEAKPAFQHDEGDAKGAPAEPPLLEAVPGETIEERAKRERARTLEIRKARRGL